MTKVLKTQAQRLELRKVSCRFSHLGMVPFESQADTEVVQGQLLKNVNNAGIRERKPVHNGFPKAPGATDFNVEERALCLHKYY